MDKSAPTSKKLLNILQQARKHSVDVKADTLHLLGQIDEASAESLLESVATKRATCPDVNAYIRAACITMRSLEEMPDTSTSSSSSSKFQLLVIFSGTFAGGVGTNSVVRASV